ncbi:hypothetical protein Tco_1087838 [Tanacetum coccineum]
MHVQNQRLRKMTLDVDFFMERGMSPSIDEFSWSFIDSKTFNTSKLFSGIFKKCIVLKLQALAWKDNASPRWVITKDKTSEFLQELVERDDERVRQLQALATKTKERADEKNVTTHNWDNTEAEFSKDLRSTFEKKCLLICGDGTHAQGELWFNGWSNWAAACTFLKLLSRNIVMVSSLVHGCCEM